MTLDNVKELDKKYYMNTFGDRIDLCFESGDGIKLKNIDGEEYYDFFAGIAVNCLGYNHKRLTEELCDQIHKLMHTSSVYYVKNQTLLAKELADNSCADKVFLANTGAEANEGAIKLAKNYFYKKGTPRTEFITLTNSFHGRTLATVAATGQPKYQKPYLPLIEKFTHVDANDINQLENAMNENVAAVMVELIQGERGVRPLDIEYAKTVRRLCDKYGAFMIVDEVQTGIGRTGKLFAYENYGIEPDIFTLAKGLGGGVTIGALCAKEEAAKGFSVGDHGTTFGGNPLSARAGLVVLDELLNNGVIDNAKNTGEYFKNELLKLSEKHSLISEVRGMGLMLGVEFGEEIAKEIGGKMRDNRYLVGVVGTKTLRIVPPLIINKEETDGFIITLDKVLSEI